MTKWHHTALHLHSICVCPSLTAFIWLQQCDATGIVWWDSPLVEKRFHCRLHVACEFTRSGFLLIHQLDYSIFMQACLTDEVYYKSKKWYELCVQIIKLSFCCSKKVENSFTFTRIHSSKIIFCVCSVKIV